MKDNRKVLLEQLAPPKSESAPNVENWGTYQNEITTKYQVSVEKVTWGEKVVFLAEWNGVYGAGETRREAMDALNLKLKGRIARFLMREDR